MEINLLLLTANKGLSQKLSQQVRPFSALIPNPLNNKIGKHYASSIFQSKHQIQMEVNHSFYSTKKQQFNKAKSFSFHASRPENQGKYKWQIINSTCFKKSSNLNDRNYQQRSKGPMDTFLSIKLQPLDCSAQQMNKKKYAKKLRVFKKKLISQFNLKSQSNEQSGCQKINTAKITIKGTKLI